MSNVKKLVINDNKCKINEFLNINKPLKGEVIIRDGKSKRVKFRGFNKVIVPGSQFVLSKLFNIKPKVFTPSYNTVLNLDHSVNEPFTGEGIRKSEQVWLFAVGTGGTVDEPTQVKTVDYSKWIQPEELVPFRYQMPTNDLGVYMRDKYFGRKTTEDRIAYYFKAFENPPQMIQQYMDGTPIDENIYLSERKDEIESFVSLELTITKEDCRDFFASTTGLKTSHIDTISLLTAYKTEYEGFIYFQDIRPLTKINIPAEFLSDTSKSLEITYNIYA